jgi:Protein of unknown function (DUF2905)
MESLAKVLLITALVLGAVGGGLLLAAKLGVGRLPGDLVIKRDGFTLYAPIGLMIVLSIVGTIVLSLLARK